LISISISIRTQSTTIIVYCKQAVGGNGLRATVRYKKDFIPYSYSTKVPRSNSTMT
jgi:hypothetical protein